MNLTDQLKGAEGFWPSAWSLKDSGATLSLFGNGGSVLIPEVSIDFFEASLCAKLQAALDTEVDRIPKDLEDLAKSAGLSIQRETRHFTRSSGDQIELKGVRILVLNKDGETVVRPMKSGRVLEAALRKLVPRNVADPNRKRPDLKGVVDDDRQIAEHRTSEPNRG